MITQTQLTHSKLYYGYELLVDSGTDSGVAGKHAHITEIIESLSSSAKGFSDNLLVHNNLPIVNVLYAYDHLDNGEVFILEFNHVIYLGKDKTESITCLNQMRLSGIHIYGRPQVLLPNSNNVQYIIAQDIRLHLKMKRSLTYMSIRRPSISEVTNHVLQTLIMTSPDDCDPYGTDAISSYALPRLQAQICLISTYILNMMSLTSSTKGTIYH